MVRSPKGSSIKENVKVCNDCFIKHKQLEKEINVCDKKLKAIEDNEGNKLGESDMDQSVVLTGSIVLGVIGFVTALLLCIFNYDTIGIGLTIGIPIIIAYVLFADGFCFMIGGTAGEIFIDIFTKSVRFPGIIFSLSLEGILDFIAIKILFFIIKLVLSIILFILGFTIASIYAGLSFPYNFFCGLKNKH